MGLGRRPRSLCAGLRDGGGGLGLKHTPHLLHRRLWRASGKQSAPTTGSPRRTTNRRSLRPALLPHF